MADGVADQKARQRELLRQRLAALKPAELTTASARIIDLLRATLGEQLTQGVMAFHPLPGEPDLRPLLQELIERGGIACLPGVDWTTKQMTPLRLDSLEQVRVGTHGVVEPDPGHPVECGELSVILVPALGFDAQGRRLGRGGGFYDRFLATCPPHLTVVGIGFRQQLLERIETGPSDVPLPMVITDAGVIEPGSSTMSAR